jgi:hypothetical protein
MMKYTIGCPTNGCSDWDYTTKVFARRKIGIDTVILQKPKYKLGNLAFDSLRYSTTPIYQTFFNSSKGSTDSTLVALQKLYSFLDAANPNLPTDSTQVYKAGFKNYTYNASGQIIDSVKVNGNQFLMQAYWSIPQYNDKFQYIEFARYITPYSGNKVNGFFRDFYLDVTDFRSVLMDSVDIGVKYEGYSDGFTVSLDFYFIKGEPIREAYKVVPIYYGGFPYGDPNNSIENYLKEVTLPTDSFTTEMGLHILQTGHGFGGNEDCAEFCPKYNFIKINGTQRFSNYVWKNDCGLNPLYPQPGTWLFDRANWCPGEMVRPFYHDISAYITAGVDVKIDMNMTPFTNVGNNSCSYNIAANVIYYRDRKGTHDLALSDVIAPSKNWQHSRFNPICAKPIVELQNNGATAINGVHVLYGFSNNPPFQSYTWQGVIAPYSKVKIELDPMDFQTQGAGTFYAAVDFVENKNDYDSSNNSMLITYNKAAVLPSKFAIEFRANAVPFENFYEIFDWQGNQIHYKDGFTANTMHKDTVNLPLGCYTFVFTDTDKDGLSFFANSDGSGSLRLRDMGNVIFKTFGADFGTEHRFQFTTDPTLLGVNNEVINATLQVYPNPSQGLAQAFADGNLSIDAYKVYNLQGKKIAEWQSEIGLSSVELNLRAEQAGLYIVEFETSNGIFREKLTILR